MSHLTEPCPTGALLDGLFCVRSTLFDATANYLFCYHPHGAAVLGGTSRTFLQVSNLQERSRWLAQLLGVWLLGAL